MKLTSGWGGRREDRLELGHCSCRGGDRHRGDPGLGSVGVNGLPLPSRTAPVVLGAGDRLQMSRVNAVTHSAEVIEFQSVRHGPHNLLVAPAVSGYGLVNPCPSIPIRAETSITGIVAGSSPKPAFTGLVHLGPEALRNRLALLRVVARRFAVGVAVFAQALVVLATQLLRVAGIGAIGDGAVRLKAHREASLSGVTGTGVSAPRPYYFTGKWVL